MSATPNPIPHPETPAETEALMLDKLAGMLTEDEIRRKAAVAHRINKLKRDRHAIVLGHNYMEPALYLSVPDFVGDSLELSRISARTDASVILFCGVQFMAETAKVLCPDRTVLIPALKAGCSLAENITPIDVRALRQKFPGVPVITYVNTYAEVKAESDYCCTSGNAAAVVRHVLGKGHPKLIFLPDGYLARNTAVEAGIPFIEGWRDDAPALAAAAETALIGWNAHCEVHELYTPAEVATIRREYPDAVILAHPECPPEVIAHIDHACSTKGMVEIIRKGGPGPYVLFTEQSMADNIRLDMPGKQLIHFQPRRCPYMELITLENTLEALEKLQYQIELPADVLSNAHQPIDRMLSIG